MVPEYTSKEFSILSYIDQNSDATQRQLSEHIGVSLGTINIVLNKLIKKGLVKIEKLQPNSIRYFLTPSGIANKLERTYGYIVRTYRELMVYQQQIVASVNNLHRANPRKKVCFFGPNDEIFQLIKAVLDTSELPADLHKEHSITSFTQLFSPSDAVLLVWKTEDEAMLKERGFMCENLLSVFACVVRNI